jgi:uncharacterized protein (DUF1800 family)
MHRNALAARTTFAPTPEAVALIDSMGPAAYIEQQLATPPLRTSGVLAGGHTLDMSIAQRYQTYRGMGSDRPARELRLAAVRRAVQNPGHLAEMMVEFWTNHFSTYSGDDDKNVRYAVATDDLAVIRTHAMGRFADLVVNNARSVSMLLYLDNYRSSGRQPNQNYARELMELHVLGEANGYDEMDVEFVARIFTGWGLAGRLDVDGLRYEYQPSRHFTDPVDVTIVLPDGTTATWSTPGRTGPEGEQDGIDFINWLVRLPNAAHFIATKLVRRFVSDNPPPSLVASTAEVYLANDTEIVPVLRHILTSEEFVTARGPKVRTPFELLVGTFAATGATIDPTWDGAASNTITEQLDRLGQAMWQWATPDGFPDSGPFWISTQTMLRRWEFGGRAGNGNLNGITIDVPALVPTPVPAIARDVFLAIAARFGIALSPNDASAIGEYVAAASDTPTADIDLARNLGDILGLILSTPAFHYR